MIEYSGLSIVICRFSHGNMNLELCIHLYMTRKKYGIYVQEFRNIFDFCIHIAIKYSINESCCSSHVCVLNLCLFVPNVYGIKIIMILLYSTHTRNRYIKLYSLVCLQSHEIC